MPLFPSSILCIHQLPLFPSSIPCIHQHLFPSSLPVFISFLPLSIYSSTALIYLLYFLSSSLSISPHSFCCSDPKYVFTICHNFLYLSPEFINCLFSFFYPLYSLTVSISSLNSCIHKLPLFIPPSQKSSAAFISFLNPLYSSTAPISFLYFLYSSLPLSHASFLFRYLLSFSSASIFFLYPQSFSLVSIPCVHHLPLFPFCIPCLHHLHFFLLLSPVLTICHNFLSLPCLHHLPQFQ
jgi:hypothetical protein